MDTSEKKKLIFCFDGTCNDPEDAEDFFADSSISNVLKLHAFLGGKLNPLNGQNEKTPNQHSFYYSGVGTRGNWLWRTINTLVAPPYGDIDDIIAQASEDLHHHDGTSDAEIYIFGFSRGAAIARMFAANCDKEVKFLGVFDTVAATRGSLDLNPDTYPSSEVVFENCTMGEHIKKAVHLVSIDEKRILFQPTLFNKDDRITEVWFSGVHSDIGGGYWFDGLSDITLQFMVDELKEDLQLLVEKGELNYADLRIKGARDVISWDDLNINPLTNGVLHEQKRAGIKAKTLAPRLVRVNVDDSPSPEHIPIVHHSVQVRFKQVAAYRPYALRNTQFRVIDGKRKISKKVYHGISELN